jgi:hypothetical protein
MAVNGNVEVGGLTGLIAASTLTVSGNFDAGNFSYPALASGSKAHINPTVAPNTYWFDHMHWVTNIFYYAAGTTGTVAGGTSINALTASGDGFARLSTTTGATNGAVMQHGYESLHGKYSSHRGRIGFWIDSTSSVGTEDFQVYVGSWSTAGTTPSRQNFYIRYNDFTGSGKFQVISANGATTTDSGVVVAANVFYVLDWSVNVTAPDGTTNPVTWSIYADGVLAAQGTGSVHAPTSFNANTESAMLAAGIKKLTGTATRNLYVDYWEFIGLK